MDACAPYSPTHTPVPPFLWSELSPACFFPTCLFTRRPLHSLQTLLADSSMIYFRESGQEWVDTGVAESSPFPLPRNLEGSFWVRQGSSVNSPTCVYSCVLWWLPWSPGSLADALFNAAWGCLPGEGSSGHVQVGSFPRSFVSKEGNVKLQLGPHSRQPRVCAEVGTQRASSCLPSSRMSPSPVLRLAVG